MKKWLKTVLCSIFLFILCLSLAACGSNNSSQNSQNSKLKRKGIKIYPVKVTNVKVSKDGDDDFYIEVRGITNAPDGSILYAQHPVKGQMSVNKAFGQSPHDYSGDDDTKIKNHHIKFSCLATALVDVDSMRAGQKIPLKVFCTNQRFSAYQELNMDNSEFINKKVRRAVTKTDVKPAIINWTQKMADFIGAE